MFTHGLRLNLAAVLLVGRRGWSVVSLLVSTIEGVCYIACIGRRHRLAPW
jgi:hypothetical protein